MGGPAGHWCHTHPGDTCSDLFMLWTWILISRLAPPLSSLSSHRCGNSCFAATRGRGGKLSLRESNCVTPTLKEQCHDLSTKGETYRYDKWGRCTIYSTYSRQIPEPILLDYVSYLRSTHAAISVSKICFITASLHREIFFIIHYPWKLPEGR